MPRDNRRLYQSYWRNKESSKNCCERVSSWERKQSSCCSVGNKRIKIDAHEMSLVTWRWWNFFDQRQRAPSHPTLLNKHKQWDLTVCECVHIISTAVSSSLVMEQYLPWVVGQWRPQVNEKDSHRSKQKQLDCIDFKFVAKECNIWHCLNPTM